MSSWSDVPAGTASAIATSCTVDDPAEIPLLTTPSSAVSNACRISGDARNAAAVSPLTVKSPRTSSCPGVTTKGTADNSGVGATVGGVGAAETGATVTGALDTVGPAVVGATVVGDGVVGLPVVGVDVGEPLNSHPPVAEHDPESLPVVHEEPIGLKVGGVPNAHPPAPSHSPMVHVLTSHETPRACPTQLNAALSHTPAVHVRTSHCAPEQFVHGESSGTIEMGVEIRHTSPMHRAAAHGARS
jgi:hypothetical protein